MFKHVCRPLAILRCASQRSIRVAGVVSPHFVPLARLQSTSTNTQAQQAWKLSQRDIETFLHDNLPISDADELLEAETKEGLAVHDMVKNDHNSFRGLLWKYHLASTNNEKLRVLHTLIREIGVHSAAEELVIHPVLSQFATSIGDLAPRQPSVDALHEQHEHIKEIFYELSGMITSVDLKSESDRGETEKVLAKAMRMMDEHMRIEELDIATLSSSLPDSDLQELGSIFEKVKRNAVLSTHGGTGTGKGFEIDVALHPTGTKTIQQIAQKLTGGR